MLPWLRRHPWAAVVPVLAILVGAGWSALANDRYFVAAASVVVAGWFALRAAARSRALRDQRR